MNNIDNIFRKLKVSEKEAPDIWDKIETELNNSNNIANDNAMKQGIEKSSINKAFHLTTTIKTIGIITATAIAGVGIYLIVDNNLQDKTTANEIVVKNNTPTINQEPVSIIPADTQNKIDNKSTEQILLLIDNKKLKKETTNDIDIEYNINDVTYEALEKNDYTIEPIKNNTTTSGLIKNNKIDIVSNDEDKVSPIEEEIPNFLPSNVVTPNGDGINDYFVINKVEKFLDNSLIILDSRGKIIYRRESYNNDFPKTNIPIGTYFYKFEYTCSGERITKSGSITVIQ